jgi:hypothetical protein
MKASTNGMMETPIHGLAEAAQYLRVPQNTLAYWLKGGGSVPSLFKSARAEPVIRKDRNQRQGQRRRTRVSAPHGSGCS